MGWDDNGLPTERRVQNYYGVRCDPSLPYDPDLTAPPDAGDPKAVAKRNTIAVSRPNFIELCHELAVEDEKIFEALFRRLGLSVDWTRTYETINDHSRRISQLAFLGNLERGEAYQVEAPSLWDITFQTAVAQAELEDKEIPGAYHKLRFDRADGGEPIWIDTTRPGAGSVGRRARRPSRRQALPASVRRRDRHEPGVRRRGAGARPRARRSRRRAPASR